MYPDGLCGRCLYFHTMNMQHGEDRTLQGCQIEWTKELGNFNIISVDSLTGYHIQPIPYKRRNFYKINLLKGKYNLHFSDRTYTIKKQALLFANPSISYNWIPLEGSHSGVYCVFTPEFFHQFGKINEYAVFHPNGTHVFELEDHQCEEIENYFERMRSEFNSDYIHRYDLLRNLIFEIIHFGTKISPRINDYRQHSDSAKRITDDFLALLERQFPIETKGQHLTLTSPMDFADKLSLHVNYLNRVLKKTMGSSTSKIVQERIFRESKVLLKHSTITISEISYLLGFKEVTHFSNFFRKLQGTPPSEYRKV
ncbi:AraC family transcriptional regulator [Flagellimonas taeanensis]|uniref:helix-turn-helix domain-containing protein n=1 Tax=Flavobacteriaceae TaxID=49546 RepID=UPI000E682F39|nr:MULTISPECIES: response regulator transcription factor [Allomuricauda]MDC6385816.1 helix-turn-helix transcriptional regulator [Muricauda sp. SK9]RIV50908.1 AraC family transcriptional regulator [Allomuricauda taeanensis]